MSSLFRSSMSHGKKIWEIPKNMKRSSIDKNIDLFLFFKKKNYQMFLFLSQNVENKFYFWLYWVIFTRFIARKHIEKTCVKSLFFNHEMTWSIISKLVLIKASLSINIFLMLVSCLIHVILDRQDQNSKVVAPRRQKMNFFNTRKVVGLFSCFPLSHACTKNFLLNNKTRDILSKSKLSEEIHWGKSFHGTEGIFLQIWKIFQMNFFPLMWK